jgi:hypothetical protein
MGDVGKSYCVACQKEKSKSCCSRFAANIFPFKHLQIAKLKVFFFQFCDLAILVTISIRLLAHSVESLHSSMHQIHEEINDGFRVLSHNNTTI